MKTIRFGDLVRTSGRPKTVTLWTKPQDNPSLSSAIKKNRVLTVVQEAGKKDLGLIGFEELTGALYLEFPRPLPSGKDARVVGINYQLIDEPAVPEKDRAKPSKPKSVHKKLVDLATLLNEKEPAERPTPPTHKRSAEPPPPPKPVVQKPKPREFIVRVRRTATIEDEIKVKALDQPAAEQLALERAKRKAFKPGETMQAEVVETEDC